eukprot:3445676-Rhodomonas_salina.1
MEAVLLFMEAVLLFMEAVMLFMEAVTPFLQPERVELLCEHIFCGGVEERECHPRYRPKSNTRNHIHGTDSAAKDSFLYWISQSCR